MAAWLATPSASQAVRVYTNDFEGAVGPEWSHANVDATPIGTRRFLGQFCNDTVRLTLRNLPAHAQVTLSFDLYVIQSWDGDQVVDPVSGGTVGPDPWQVALGNGEVLLRTTFSNVDGPPYYYPQSYPGWFPGTSHQYGTGATERNTLGYTFTYATGGTRPADSIYHLTFDVAHADSTCTFEFSASGLQGIGDESWGLDNVCVEILDEQALYAEDFEGGAGPEWSHPVTDVTPIGARRFLGQFANDTVVLTLGALPPHDRLRLSFDLFVIQSWDGDGLPDPWGDIYGPDIWSVGLQNGPVFLSTTFDNHHMAFHRDYHQQAYPGSYRSGGYTPQTGATETNTLGYTFNYPEAGVSASDAVYHLSFDFTHSASTCALAFSASGLQGIGDESWGLDNVVVRLDGAGERPEGTCFLTISSSDGGTVTVPGEGQFQCTAGATLSIKATPASSSYEFVRWTGTAVDFGKVVDSSAASTQVHVDGDYTLRAEFRRLSPRVHLTAYAPSPANGAQGVVSRTLRWSAGQTAARHNVYLGPNASLGSATLIGRRTTADCLIPYALVPGTMYYWRVDEVEADGVTIHEGEVWSFTAGAPAMQVLTVSSYGQGSVVTPGEGQFQIPQGTVLSIEAAPADSAVQFRAWTGSAVSQGKVL
ncbi:MAG: hypothetical protein JW993_01150, partial [Sedimentisphaerales bacterium]|nr:hypothetical protein [Sedimentisphaerales bacterium]